MIKWGNFGMLQYLWAIVPTAWLIVLLVRLSEKRLNSLVDARILPRVAPDRWKERLRTKNGIWITAVALLIMALARPQWGFHWQEVKRRGLDILVVLDTSNSMRAQDLKPSRLQQAKWGIRDLLQRLTGDRIGLIAFAGSSFLQCPLTIDYAAFSMMLEDVYPGIIPKGGTAIAQALETAVGSFNEGGEADRVVVLITDGEDHEGDMEGILEKLKKENIRVFAVGVGTTEGELIPAPEGKGSSFFKDRSGNVVKTALREDALKNMAAATGGIYVRSASGDFGLDRIFNQGIADLKRDEKESKMIKAYEERFAWFLGASLLLLGLEAALGDRRRKKGGTLP